MASGVLTEPSGLLVGTGEDCLARFFLVDASWPFKKLAALSRAESMTLKAGAVVFCAAGERPPILSWIHADDSTAAALAGEARAFPEVFSIGEGAIVNVSDKISTVLPSVVWSVAVMMWLPASGFHAVETVCAAPAASVILLVPITALAS